MGGMTVLSHARQFPQRYPSRVCGVAIIASAAQGVSRSPLGEVLQNPALEAAKAAVRFAPGAVTRGRGAARAVISPVLKAASFGDTLVSPAVVAYAEKMMHDTPVRTMVEFLHALEVHDEAAALPVLAKVPALIACGDQDLLTPLAKSKAMARQLPKSELVIAEGAGHMVHMEQPELINDALVRFVERATPSRLVALTRRLRKRARSDG
jgi:pimeloyl-ACP methyl ester carboxylesterase